MLKKMLALSLLLAFAFGIVNAQSKKAIATEKAQYVDINLDEQMPNFNLDYKNVKLKKINAAALVQTNYDYACNASVQNMIDLGSLDKATVGLITAMKRLSTQTVRSVEFFIGNLDGFASLTVNGGGAGWGTIFKGKGFVESKTLVMYHRGGNSRLKFIDENLNVSAEKTILQGNFPSFVILPDGKMLVTNTNGMLYSSLDTGSTTTQLLDLFPERATDGNAELLLRVSDNGQYVAHVAPYDVRGNGGKYGTQTNPDSVDVTILRYSTDGGQNWSYREIAYDGITTLANRTEFYPLFENFGQVQFAVGNMGIVHVVMNGYGFRGINDTTATFAFPVIYWNNIEGVWKAISDFNVDTINSAILASLRPGNGIGQSYPCVSISKDGNLVVALWQGPEFVGAVGQSQVAIYNGTNPKFYTDLYYAYSTDAGATWSAPQVLKGEKQVQESYPYANLFVEELGNNEYKVHYVYMVDAIPGTSLFGNNNGPSDETTWYYDQLVINAQVVSAEKEAVKANTFELSQNYPNPFNPATTINYSIPENGFVSLRVFDMLGREVAVLVNEYQTAGKNTVRFDASNLTSGVYVYTLQFNGKVQSKKMILMK